MSEGLREARDGVAEIARQKLTTEVRHDPDYGDADYEGAYDACVEKARAILPKLDAALDAAGRVEDGWKLVPVEPTPEMCKAGEAAMSFKDIPGTSILEDADEASIYRAMIAASPSQNRKGG